MIEARQPTNKIPAVGMTVTVFTVDGRATKGKVTTYTIDLIGIETDLGAFTIPAHAISSVFVSNEDEPKVKA
jgi:sRNA-binding regulator protein Hfq